MNEQAKGKVWHFGQIVRQAQADFVRKDKHAAIVISTDEYKYSDPWHYDSAGYLDLGASLKHPCINKGQNKMQRNGVIRPVSRHRTACAVPL